MPRTIYIACGMAGSGKTTYLSNTPSSDDVVLRRDPFARIHGYDGGPWRAFITAEITRNPHKTVFIDQATTHLDSLKRLLYGVNWLEDDEIVLLAFTTPLQVCRDRVCKREHGQINPGLQYIFKEDARDNPQITQEELESLKFTKRKLSWKGISQ